MKRIEKQLMDIVGPEHVSSDLADLVAYERDDQFALVPPHRPDYIVRPSTREEIRAIIRCANRYRIPVVPLAAGINRKGLCIPTKGGILLDLRRMNRILEINEEMMTATIEPGVNFGQLVQEVKKTGLRVITPWAPSTASVLANYMLRGIYGPSTRYGIDHLISIEVVLPNGDVLQTGSANTPKAMPYCGIVYGPDLCKLFQANPGTFGVLTKGTIRLYPMPEVIKPLMTSHASYEAMIEPAIEMVKRNLVAGCWTMMFTRKALKIMAEGSLFEEFVDILPENFYTMWLFVEGNREQAETDEKAVKELVEESEGVVLPITTEMEEGMIKDHIWERTSVRGWKKGSLYGCSFYGVMKLAPKYYEACHAISEKYGFDEFHYEAVPVAPFHGQLAYNDPCVAWDSGNPEEVERIRKLHKELMKALLDIGIYGWFRPFPGVVDAGQLGKYGELWRKIKKLIDPNDIMNPGKPPIG